MQSLIGITIFLEIYKNLSNFSKKVKGHHLWLKHQRGLAVQILDSHTYVGASCTVHVEKTFSQDSSVDVAILAKKTFGKALLALTILNS